VPIMMDQILSEYADQALEVSRLGRNSVHVTGDLVFAEMLAELEAAGFAMRFVNAERRIGWMGTPRLHDHLKNLELDAHADFEDVE
jgi:hypothetical protein